MEEDRARAHSDKRDNSLWKTCPDKSRARADAEWTIGEADAFRAGAEAMRARAAHEVSGAFISDGMPPLERWARMEQSLDAYRRIAALPIPEPGE